LERGPATEDTGLREQSMDVERGDTKDKDEPIVLRRTDPGAMKNVKRAAGIGTTFDRNSRWMEGGRGC